TRLYALDYPRLAVQAGISGTVVLRCGLRPDGSVSSVIPVSGPTILAEAAAANAAKWMFPGRPKKGKNTVVLTYRFVLRETPFSTVTSTNEFIFEVTVENGVSR